MKILLSLLISVSTVFTEKLDKPKDIYDKFQQNDYQLTFERLELTRYNKEYFKFASVNTFKHNRTCPVTNLTFLLNVDVGNDVEVIVQGYKFMSNEYRFFPMHFGVNLCKAISTNVMGLGRYRNCGNFTGCPILKGKLYHICNWTPDAAKLPPFMPNGEYMIEIQGTYYSKEIYLLKGYAIISRAIAIK